MRGARREHPRQWAVTDEQPSRWPGAAPPRRAGAVWLSGVVARSLQTAGGYARRSRLARQPNSRQQNRNLFLNRPLALTDRLESLSVVASDLSLLKFSGTNKVVQSGLTSAATSLTGR